MTEIASSSPVEGGSSGRKPLIFGLILAILGGGGAFYATWSGLLAGATETSAVPAGDIRDIAFVPVEPVVISLPSTTGTRQLRFTAQIEAHAEYAADVTRLMPRLLDVMNSYLRALEPARFEEPGALLKIRAQLLRRLQIVTGDGRVRDLLVTEFVLQ